MVAQRRKSGLSKEEAFAGAWRLITDVNPFPATLGRICPHPCENHCNRADLDEPLAINAMERFLGDFAIRADLPLPRLDGSERREWIGVVGAGPSGLSFAYQMARRGYRVTVYDAREQAGGMLRYGVPDYRLPQDVLDAEIGKITELGVELQLNTRIGKDLSLVDLRGRHPSLYLAIGAQRGQGLDIPGMDGPSVWTGTDYLGRINRGESVDVGSKAIVIGGGNTAIDAARCARRTGARVHILYRRSRSEMPAIAHEIDDALEEGVVLDELSCVTAIERGVDGRIDGVRAQRMVLGDPDSSGRRRPLPVPDSDFRMKADSLIAAVSQVPALDGFESLAHEGDWLVSDRQSAEHGILAGGDALGLGIAGEAIVQGRRAAERLHGQFTGQSRDKPASAGQSTIPAEEILFESKPGQKAVHPAELPGSERVRLGMTEVAQGISEEQFLSEAERCFSCGSCFGCEQCYMYCTTGCFTPVDDPGPGRYFTLNLDECHECGKCIEVCPCGFLEVS